MAKLCLNLGSGNDYRKSDEERTWVNVDKGFCLMDYYLDIEKTPWIFCDPNDTEKAYDISEFDEIHAIQVLEHIDPHLFGDIIREMYQRSRAGAEWFIAVPHAFSDNFITDPTHQMRYSTRTFDYFVDGTQLRENGRIYGWSDIHLSHITPPGIDGNQSIIFHLGVIKVLDADDKENI